VLAIVFATAAIAGSGPTAPAAADASPAAEASPAKKRTNEAAETVRLRPVDYLGRDHKEVRKELEALGLEVTEEKVAAESPEQRKGTVTSLTPHGKVPAAATVTLGVLEKYKPPRSHGRADDRGEGWDPSGWGEARSDRGEKSWGKGRDDRDWDDEDDWDDEGWGEHGNGEGRGEGEHD
jgi:hypothetical protein